MVDVINTKLGRSLILVALLGGGIGNYRLSTVDVSDRFKAADFRREITNRDRRIAGLEIDLERLELSNGIHLQHSARYTEVIDRVAKQCDEVEKDLKQHLRLKH